MAFYFTIMRPVGIGSCPRGFEWYNNFDRRIEVPCINRRAWGVLEYAEPLADKEVKAYELVEANLVWIGAYRDLYNLDWWDNPKKYGDDNYMEVLLPVDWVKENIGLTGYNSYEEFCSEYTSDDTEALYAEAVKNNVIYGRVF